MTMKKYSLYIWLLAGILASCGDFLEESSQDLMIGAEYEPLSVDVNLSNTYSNQ